MPRIPVFQSMPIPSRREVLKAGGAAGALALASPYISRAHAQDFEDTLVLTGNGGNTQEIIEKELFPAFSERTGVKNLVYVAGGGSETLSKLRLQKDQPNLDVAWMSTEVLVHATREEIVAPYNKDLIPNAKLVPAELFSGDVSVPFGQSVSGILHNHEIFGKNGFEAPASWFDLWDPRFKGHVGILSITSTGTKNLVPMIAKALTGDWKNWDAALEKFAELRENLFDVFASPGEMESSLLQGDLWIEAHNSARALQVKNGGAPIAWTKPKEGHCGWQIDLGVVKGAPHPKAAHAWINYVLDPEVQKQVAFVMGYTPVNPGVEIPSDVAAYFPDVSSVFVPDWFYIADRVEELTDKWNRMVER